MLPRRSSIEAPVSWRTREPLPRTGSGRAPSVRRPLRGFLFPAFQLLAGGTAWTRSTRPYPPSPRGWWSMHQGSGSRWPLPRRHVTDADRAVRSAAGSG
ncbi:hypothetical protein LI90_1358 [Carbonactinospora thermoautotrophica]|uniref:Uncharacterized protein n=1 Tax=Carbonactinospora thermoautotrophica TaxID=1469144 RepID=A0A132MPR2_9ACTN|nr:hypothetical protein LI90_1358 [Carbonactinospora thermoautotrophica]